MNVREYLEEYKSVTLDLMEIIKRRDNQGEDLIKQRDKILEIMRNSSDIDKEEIKIIGNSLGLLELEKELQDLSQKEKVKIRKEIEMLKKSKQANMNYNRIENKSRVFNKSI
ncbi:hypothetical protein [Clostridium beijerinckii]|uniref:hypothetical protein n=1 Tax=Clostridium beijerinckii TaxID=1520 RepID=UPI0002DFE06C|nr:hypothetical protein [Clostridium beijerinckii]